MIRQKFGSESTKSHKLLGTNFASGGITFAEQGFIVESGWGVGSINETENSSIIEACDVESKHSIAVIFD